MWVPTLLQRTAKVVSFSRSVLAISSVVFCMLAMSDVVLVAGDVDEIPNTLVSCCEVSWGFGVST